jgi:hypothetical protein
MRIAVFVSEVVGAWAVPVDAVEADAQTEARYGCTVESRTNQSTREALPVEQAPLIFTVSEMDTRGGLLTKAETLKEGDREAFATHTIDPTTGRYAATTLLTDHSFGEQYLIEASGVCEVLADE